MERIIEASDLSKSYGKELILKNINFSIYRRNFISIVGPNGCGKSTLVKIIAGLELPTSGEVKRFKDPKISFVFQNHSESLLPWRDVYHNISLPLEIKGESEDKKRKKIIKIVEEFGLEKHLKKYPFQLSGGLLQLTAIARALVDQPEVLILDEPFKSLDFDLSQQIIKHVIKYCEKKSITTILVSHDIDQAILFADKIFVFSQSPSKIKEIINISLDRPRKLDLMKDKRFFKLKNKILEVFRK